MFLFELKKSFRNAKLNDSCLCLGSSILVEILSYLSYKSRLIWFYKAPEITLWSNSDIFMVAISY